MRYRTYTLPVLGGLMSSLALFGCADGESSQPDSSNGLGSDAAPAARSQPAEPQADGTLVLDGAGLPPFPTNLGDRLFDIIVHMNEDGSLTRKIFETTPAQREAGAKMTADLEKFFDKHAGNPSEAAITEWRTSWGLPTIEETARNTEELMKLPYDVFLNESLDDAVNIDFKGLEESGLRVMEGTQALAAQGFTYIYAPTGGNGVSPTSIPNSNGGACAPYMPGGQGTVMYWTAQNFYGHVLCFVNLWKSEPDGYVKINHASTIYWPHGTDVDSYCSIGHERVDSGTSTTCNSDGHNAGFRCGSLSGNFLDGKTHTCYDPVFTTPP